MTLIERLLKDANDRQMEGSWKKDGTSWDTQTGDLLEEAAMNLGLAQHIINDLDAKLRYLLEYGDHYGEDGVFCFPDGDIWRNHDIG